LVQQQGRLLLLPSCGSVVPLMTFLTPADAVAAAGDWWWCFPAPLWTLRSYSNPHPAADDYAKEPPVMPPHLQLTLLNVPPTADTRACLPRPQHVILNHIYLQRGQVRG
jgi:hypothetical protein